MDNIIAALEIFRHYGGEYDCWYSYKYGSC